MKKILIVAFAALMLTFASLTYAAVDLNSATAAELESVKGIGPAKAKAIIEHREKSGPFKSVDDLKGIKGFGAKTIEKLRPELTVGGAPAAPAVAAPKAAAPMAPTPTPAPAAPPAKK